MSSGIVTCIVFSGSFLYYNGNQAMAGNVLNPVLWLDKLVDFHDPDCMAEHPPRQRKRPASKA